MSRTLPEKPNLEYLKKDAKALLRTMPGAKLADAQHALAQEYGFASWAKLKAHVESLTLTPALALTAAIRDMDAGRVRTLLERHAELRARINASLEKKWLRDRERSHFEEMRVEKQRWEALLLNILPQSIVSRMRNGETVIADRHEDATILFVDLVGFTSLSTQYPPDKVLDILSKIFARFDGAVAAHGLEKIKTIGDAYMVAGGLPEPIADHTRRAAQLAIEMLAIVRQNCEIRSKSTSRQGSEFIPGLSLPE